MRTPTGDIAMSEWLMLERLEGNDLPLPKYATDHSVGVDFAACLNRTSYRIEQDGTKTPISGTKTIEFASHETIMIPLGFKCEFGEEYVLTLHVRSSVGLRGFLLANGTGIVDPDYRGDLFACMFNRTTHNLTVEHGQRIVQGILIQFNRPVILEGPVGMTERGVKGFGSSGE